MKKFIVFVMCLSFFLLTVACSATNGQNNDADKQSGASNPFAENIESDNENDINQDVKEKFVIDLNLNNYMNYFEVSFSTSEYSSSVKVSGCLSYALYQTVTFTIEDTSTGSVETFKCNAAGNGSSLMRLALTYNVEITNVSGQVIYWM